jgi:hypothetical protein
LRTSFRIYIIESAANATFEFPEITGRKVIVSKEFYLEIKFI